MMEDRPGRSSKPKGISWSRSSEGERREDSVNHDKFRGERSERKREKGPVEFIHGIHPVKEALASGKNLERLMIKKGNDRALRDLARVAGKEGIPIQEVPVEKLNRVTRKNHQGVVAFLSPITYADLSNVVMEAFENGKDPLILLLDGVTDIGNFGAICRTAECCGVDAVVIPMKGRAQINSVAVKSSAGALLNISVCREDSLKRTVEYLKECGCKVVSCTEKTENSLAGAELRGPLAVIMGSEEVGISKSILELSDQRLSIPMLGKTASMNVSVATGIMLYEVVKTRLQEIE